MTTIVYNANNDQLIDPPADHIAYYGTVEYKGRLYVHYPSRFWLVATETGDVSIPAWDRDAWTWCSFTLNRILTEDVHWLPGDHRRIARWNLMKLKINEVTGDYSYSYH